MYETLTSQEGMFNKTLLCVITAKCENRRFSVSQIETKSKKCAAVEELQKDIHKQQRFELVDFSCFVIVIKIKAIYRIIIIKMP